MPQGEKHFYASKPSLKQSTMQSTRTSSQLAKAPQLENNLSAVPTAPTLKDTVEGGAPSAPGVPVAVQGPVVISNNSPMAASVPKEPEDGLLLQVVSAPSSVAIGKEMSRHYHQATMIVAVVTVWIVIVVVKVAVVVMVVIVAVPLQVLVPIKRSP
jgi:hypothetical protein